MSDIYDTIGEQIAKPFMLDSQLFSNNTPYMFVCDGKEVFKCNIKDGIIQAPKNKP